jgi:hypothetical protein
MRVTTSTSPAQDGPRSCRMTVGPRRKPPPGGRQPSRRCEAYAQGTKGEDKPCHPGRKLPDATSRGTFFKLTHRDPRFEQ